MNIELELLKNDYLKFDSNNDESTDYLLVKMGKDVEIILSISQNSVN